MRPAIDAADVERFRGIVAARFGLQFEDGRRPFLEAVLRRRLEAHNLESAGYLSRLEHIAGAEHESGALAQELTVGETYFFRNREQFDALVDHVLPERLAARRTARQLNVLSAGCASGEEPFTLAMVLRQALDGSGRRASIRAVDINAAALQRARAARFGRWALRETPAGMVERWFRPAGHEWVLAEEIASAVQFERRNIADESTDLWPPRHYDVVFCRNVLMYFAPDRARQVLARIAGALAPGGYLFLGHAETLRGLSEDFSLVQSDGTFYYRLNDATESIPRSASAPAPVSDPSARRASDDDWFAAIGSSADRVRRLGRDEPVAAVGAAPPAPAWTIALILALLCDDRLAEAIALIDTAPARGDDPDAQLVSAALLVHDGRFEAAARMARTLLSCDAASPGGHYLLALCDDRAGELGTAMDRDRLAIDLDPGFAMPQLHLGLLARRAGNKEAAQQAFAAATRLLRHEDETRILLFGGGFTRSALMAMCQAELAALRGRSR